ncbi:hypothetical protein F4805DRAFT_456639 [Annulohypoxylon moriforme]|nr:hypothetical protein F4805DRAFT_456639 [Annulohypoxylon moriforme]
MSAKKVNVKLLGFLVLRQFPNLQAQFDKVEHLDFAPDDCNHHLFFENYKFRKLRTIKLAFSGHNNDYTLLPYIQPALEKFHFHGGPISDRTLERLQTCPALEELLIENPRFNCCTPEGFRRFIEATKSLRNLTIQCGMDHIVGNDVFRTLAKSSNLRALDFRLQITARLVDEALANRQEFSSNKQLFGELKRLICIAHYQGITRLLSHLPKLTHLEVSINGADHPETMGRDLFPELLKLRLQLRVLKIEYLCGYPIQIDPIMMRDFVREGGWNMERLEVSGKMVEGTGFTRPVLDILQSAGNLRFLRLSMKCDLTEVALRAAAAFGGRRLIELDIGGTYDFDKLLRMFSTKKFTFGEQFKFLGIGKLIVPPFDLNIEELEPKADEFARLVKAIAPSIEDFNVLDPDKFTDMVEKVLIDIFAETGWKQDLYDSDGPNIAVGPGNL